MSKKVVYTATTLSTTFQENYIYCFLFCCVSIWVFLSRTFTNRRTAEEGGGHFFNSSLPLPPASQTRRHQPGDRCRGLTSAHSQQPDSNREPLVSEHKSLTTKLRALYIQDATTFILNCVLKTVLCTRKWLSHNPYKKLQQIIQSCYLKVIYPAWLMLNHFFQTEFKNPHSLRHFDRYLKGTLADA